MKKVLLYVTVLTILSMVFSACTPNGTEDATDEPASTEAPGEAPATEAPTEAAATEEAAPAPVSIDLAGPPMELGSKYLYVDGTVLVAVPGGPFIMGYNFADNPEREVTVGDFWVYSTEVTNSQYALCVQAGKCTPPDPENAPDYGKTEFTNFPVTGVTHTQATDYCAFVKGRLPTEAEWEKAARGPEGNIFPWGDGAPNCSLTNYASCKGKTTSINDYPTGKSYYELWDMSGNTREWVADWYEALYNVENPVANPLGPELGVKRSVRGAGFTDSANATIAASRFSLDPEENLPDLGFRCVVEGDPSEKFAPWCELVGYAGTGPDGSPANCTPQVQCNDVDATLSQGCSGPFLPYNVVTLELTNAPPNGVTMNPPAGCTLIDSNATTSKYLCTPPDASGSASITGSCTDVSNCASNCPMYYKKEGDKCVWDGGGTAGTQCLPGSTYDPLTQCCTALPGMGTDFNLCPVGFYFLNGVCVPNPKGVAPSDSVTLSFPSCDPGKPDDDPGDPGDEPDDPGGGNPGGGNPGGCTQPPQCQTWEVLDPKTCTCIP